MIRLLILLISFNCYGQPIPQQDSNTNVFNKLATWARPYDPNTVGFYFYQGTNKIDCGTTTYQYFSYTGCTPILAVSGYDINKRESQLIYQSNTLSANQTVLLKLNHPCAIGSTNLNDWYPITNVLVPCNKPQEFFRVIQ